MIRDCTIDDQRLEPLKECLPLPGTDIGEDEWPNNTLSHKTVIYSCGRIGRRDEVIEHAHDPAELALCKRLADEATAIMAGTYLGMSDESDHKFVPFFITANVGDKVPETLTETELRAAFGGTIKPKFPMTIEPLKEEGEWWRMASAQPISDGDDKALNAWRSMIAWFGNQPELHGACFVCFNEPKAEPYRPGVLSCVIFPRMVLAFTKQGSLVGLFGCVVWT